MYDTKLETALVKVSNVLSGTMSVLDKGGDVECDGGIMARDYKE